MQSDDFFFYQKSNFGFDYDPFIVQSLNTNQVFTLLLAGIMGT